MNPKIKKQWVAALRSGKYAQGRRKLRDTDDRFCCLGVLCNLHAIAHPDVARNETSPTSYMTHTGLPAPAVVKWAGLSNSDPIIPSLRRHLSAINDEGTSFSTIADLIEREL